MNNAELVNEVIHYAKSAYVFSGPPSAMPCEIKRVLKFPDTIIYDGRDASPQHEWDLNDENQASFEDIKGHYRGALEARIMEGNNRNLIKDIDLFVGEEKFIKEFSRKLPVVAREWSYYFHWDIVLIAQSRAIYGAPDVIDDLGPNLFERLYDVYKLGGIPVGWWGEIYNPRLLAYFNEE